MAKVAYPGGSTSVVTASNAATFIPEIWSDEVIAAYKKNLVLANLVRKMSFKGKKGDTLHIPKPTRGSATLKAANTAVTIQADVETEVQVLINRHFEYSRFIEDITEVQALASLRSFYTEDAGYALAKQVDDDLINLGKTFGNGTTTFVHSNSYYIDASTGLTAYAVDTVVDTDVFTDAGFRKLIQLMDDADVPMDGRKFAIPPSLRNAIMGIDRYNSSDFVDGRGVNNGQIGKLYGIDIYVSSNMPVIETATDNTASGNSLDIKAAMLFHTDTMVLAEQLGVRSQTQYKQDFLSTLYTADTLFGTKVVRPEAGFVLAVNG
jgi:HK97 family phage major capsid protein